MIDGSQGASVSRPATLFDLQASIACLLPGQRFPLSQLDYERLFGIGDIARSRLSNFAATCRCVAAYDENGVTFNRADAA